MEWLFWTLLALALSLGAFTAVRVIQGIRAMTKDSKPLRVYVAGPYSQGDPEKNTLRAIEAADALLHAGYCPYTPHLSHFHHKVHPHDYEVWMRLDFAYLAVCDVLIRLPGYSPGAEREVAMARERGIPIYYSVADFLEERGECLDR